MKALIIYDQDGTIYNTIYGADGLVISTIETDIPAGGVPERVDVSGEVPVLVCPVSEELRVQVEAALEEERWNTAVASVKARIAAGEEMQEVIDSLDMTDAEKWKLEAAVKEG